MHHDPSQAWIDHDPLLAARLKQHPGSSSIDLVNDLVAETGLHWSKAMRIVDDYTFRKALDTSEADGAALRTVLSPYLRGFAGLAASIFVGHLTALFLPPRMRMVIRMAGFAVGAAMLLVALARKSLDGPGRSSPGSPIGREEPGIPAIL